MLKNIGLLACVLPLVLSSCNKIDKPHHQGIRDWRKSAGSCRNEVQVYSVANVTFNLINDTSEETSYTISTGYLEQTSKGVNINGDEEFLPSGYLVYPSARKVDNIEKAIDKVDD